ncbi:MAG: C4-dicarboxylate TRAP transporter substrate-binding protein [Gemmobacter sp.]
MKPIRTAALALTLAGTPLAASAASFDAIVVAGHPPVFRWVQMISQAFIPAATEGFAAAGHTITFNEQYGGSLAPVGEELETVGAGIAQIGVCQSLFDPAKLAIQNVTYYTPFVSADARQISMLIDELHKSDERMTAAYLENDNVYLGAPVAIDDYLLMTNFPVNSLDDLRGRKIAAPGAAINWLSGTGAVGVSGNLTTYYNELKAGVYDGVIVFASAALPGKLYEVAPHITRAGLGAQFAGALCANRDWYNALPEEGRAALHAAADVARDWYLDALEGAVATSLEKMAAEGATITEASAEMRQAWAAGMDNAAKKWAAELDGRGLPATEMLGTYMDAMRAAGATPLRDWDRE